MPGIILSSSYILSITYWPCILKEIILTSSSSCNSSYKYLHNAICVLGPVQGHMNLYFGITKLKQLISKLKWRESFNLPYLKKERTGQDSFSGTNFIALKNSEPINLKCIISWMTAFIWLTLHPLENVKIFVWKYFHMVEK